MLPQSTMLKYTRPFNGGAMRRTPTYSNASSWNRDVATHFLQVADAQQYPYFVGAGMGNMPRQYIVQQQQPAPVSPEMQPPPSQMPMVPGRRYPQAQSGNGFFKSSDEYMSGGYPRYPSRSQFIAPIDPSNVPSGAMDVPHVAPNLNPIAVAENRMSQFPGELGEMMNGGGWGGGMRPDALFWLMLGVAIVEAFFILSLLHIVRKTR